MIRKIFLFGGGCFALLLILLVAFVLLLPYLVNLESVRERIEALLFQQVGGRVEYQKIDLFYFPRPGVKAHQVTLSIDEKVAGTAQSVQVYPELAALFKGKLRVARIQVESPDVAVRIPTERAEVKERPEGTALKEFEEIVARVAVIVPRLKVVMKDGRLNLLKGSQTVLSFSDINANMTGPPGEAKIEIACRSNLWEKMSAEATINPVDLNGQGHIKIASFHPHLLSGFLSPDFPLKVTDSELNLNLSFETKGQEVFQAALEGSISKLTLEEGSQETVIRGKRFQGAFQMEGGRLDISLGRTQSRISTPHPVRKVQDRSETIRSWSGGTGQRTGCDFDTRSDPATCREDSCDEYDFRYCQGRQDSAHYFSIARPQGV